MSKKFYTCYTCRNLEKCLAGKSRLEHVEINSPIIQDIGCFEMEIYKEQIKPKQLKLEF